MEKIFDFITRDAFVLIPVIFILNRIIKGTEKIKEKYIPLVMLFISLAFSFYMLGLNANGFINGVLVLGASFYLNNCSIINDNKK